MTDQIDAAQVLDGVRRQEVTDAVYAAYLARERVTLATLRRFAVGGESFVARLRGLLRNASKGMSRGALQRAINKMSSEEREQFGQSLVGP